MSINSQSGKRLHVRAGARGERVERIPAFETGNDAARGMLFRQFENAFGYPGVVVDGQQQLGQRVTGVSVETRRYEDELRRKPVDLGKPMRLDCRAKLAAFRARWQRHVRDVPGLGGRTRVGVERMLVARTQQHPVILQKYFFGTVAVVHVEVQDGDPLHGAAGQRVGGGDGDVVVVAEPHGRSLAGMMAGRAYATKGRCSAALEHEFGS